MASRCAVIALCGSSSERKEAHALQGIDVMRSLNFQVGSILRMDKPVDLKVAAFPLACFFNAQHVFLRLFKHGRKIRSCVQVTSDTWPHKFQMLFLERNISLFLCKEIVVSVSYIVHSLQYKVLKCPTKININVTVAGVFSTIDPCHS